LVSPEGPLLDSKVIDSLTGYTAYAQAAGVTPPAAKVIGHVVKMTGTASCVRNGVTIELNNSAGTPSDVVVVLSSAVEVVTAGLAAIGELFAISSSILFLRSSGVLGSGD
jgi:hypothetical protein